jgi:type IV secretory pathway VirD2 relaxase
LDKTLNSGNFGGLGIQSLEEIFRPPVKRKRNTTADMLMAKAARVVNGVPEVMVKITGFGKGVAHVQAHLAYISRKGKVELETDRGEKLAGSDAIKDYFSDWQQSIDSRKRRVNQRDTMHLVLSMPTSVDAESVRLAVQDFAKKTFSKNHEYVFALHTDELHPHCHLTVKTLGFDGKRLNPRKADLQEWREGFADAMRLQGVEAEATPRRSRGVVKKAEKGVIRHIAGGHKPRVSRVRVAKQQEALHELAAEAKNQPVDVQPWDVSIKATQTTIREKWVAVANDLEKAASPDSKALAGRINGFVVGMPAMETERHQIKRELRQVASQDKTHHKNKEIER